MEFDYSKAILNARLKLEEAEVRTVKNPTDLEAKRQFKEALQSYKTTLEDPLGLQATA